MRRFLLIPLVFILIVPFSCLTSLDQMPPYIPPLSNVLIEDIEELVGKQEFLQALQVIERMRREDRDIPSEKLESLQDRSLQGARAAFLQAVEQDEIGRAMALFTSLQTIGSESLVAGWSIHRLHYAFGLKQEADGYRTVALLHFLNAAASGKLSTAQLQHVTDLAFSLGNSGALQVLVPLVESQGGIVTNEIKQLAMIKNSITSMINGTVTIWVDKGMKLERGVSTLDRVIGSGFFIDPDGYLLTNYHVIESEVNPVYEGFSRLYVRLSEKPEQKIPAKVVGFDPVFDLALVKVEIEPKFIFSTIRETDPELGEKLTVIGSPIGLENTVTSGIVSAKGRRFLQIGDALQIDAPVNHGNSGGPVVDESGRLLGIIFAGLEQFEGINFAIASEWINVVLPRLYQGGAARHYWAGISCLETDLGLKIIYAVPGEPGDNAGLRSGDIIETVNGTAYHTIRDMQMVLEGFQDQALVTLKIKRGGETFSALVCLSERPRVPVKVALERDAKSNIIYPLFGMKIERVKESSEVARFLVVDVLPGSIAEELGLSDNDPVDIRGWYVDPTSTFVAVEVKVQRRKLGFLETFIQLLSAMEIDSFI